MGAGTREHVFGFLFGKRDEAAARRMKRTFDPENLSPEDRAQLIAGDGPAQAETEIGSGTPTGEPIIDPQTGQSLNPLLDGDRIAQLQGDPERQAPRPVTADEITQRARAKLDELEAQAQQEGGLTSDQEELAVFLRRNVGNPQALADFLGAELIEAPAQPNEPARQSNVIEPLTPPWVDQETGEVSIPTRDELRAALEAQMQAQFAADGTTVVDAEALAAAWQATGVDVSPTAIAQVARAIHKTFKPAEPPTGAEAPAPTATEPAPVQPAIPFPDAPPSSLADAANAIVANQSAPVPPADVQTIPENVSTSELTSSQNPESVTQPESPFTAEELAEDERQAGMPEPASGEGVGGKVEAARQELEQLESAHKRARGQEKRDLAQQVAQQKK